MLRKKFIFFIINNALKQQKFRIIFEYSCDCDFHVKSFIAIDLLTAALHIKNSLSKFHLHFAKKNTQHQLDYANHVHLPERQHRLSVQLN